MKANTSVVLTTLLIAALATSKILAARERQLMDHDDLSSMMDTADSGKLNSHNRQPHHESAGTRQPREPSQEETGPRAQLDHRNPALPHQQEEGREERTEEGPGFEAPRSPIE